MFHLQRNCFLKLLDLSPEEIAGLLDLAADLKARKKAGNQPARPLHLLSGYDYQGTIPLSVQCGNPYWL